MYFVNIIRDKGEPLLKPLAAQLNKKNITPNQITLATLVGSLVTGLFLFLTQYSFKWLYILPIWVIVRIALNVIDGVMARDFDQVTYEGAVLNETEYVLSDLFLYLPLMALDKIAAWTILIFLVAVFATEFCGVLMQALGAGRQNQGPMGKFDRAICIGILGLVTALVPGFIVFWNFLFIVGIALCVITCKNRIFAGLEKLNKKKKR